MYRVLFLLAILALTECHFCNKHKPSWRHRHSQSWRHRGHVDPDAEIIQNNIDFKETLQNYCVKNAKNQIHEVYGSVNYILKYDIPEYENGEISVKIINRLIQVTANKENDDGNIEFKDVRLLPDILNYEKASWIFEGKMLKIYIPYTITLGKDMVKTCGAVNKDVINVPVAESAQFQLRMLDDDSAINVIEQDASSFTPPVVY